MRKLILVVISIFISNVVIAESAPKWELLQDADGLRSRSTTWRIQVPEGWVLRGSSPEGMGGVAMVFIPDRFHDWKLGT